ncbi:MAG: geranylgeranylglyceryl/heptaprenylglyceryl phosphate synthase [candidate division Zixibacteria bacterium]
MSDVFRSLIDRQSRMGGGFFLLLDPDRAEPNRLIALAEAADDCGVDAILVGTSFSLSSNFTKMVKEIKSVATRPLIIFPGSFAQISPYADAILFTSLISGRNPSYLIDEQMKGAPLVKECGLEVIPTGYMLIESGSLTSVQFIAGCLPIPRSKNDLACAHALAGQYLGMKMIYLEAGSGASDSVPNEMIGAVANYIDIPVMVGGGMRNPEECADKIEAGASFVVVGTAFEDDQGFGKLREMTEASHPLETVEA